MMEEKNKENLDEKVDLEKEDLAEEPDLEEKSPEDPVEVTEEEKEEIGEIKEASNPEDESLRTSLARLQADFQNYRTRTEKEKSDIYAYASEKLIIKLLPVIDNLERAMASEKDHDSFFEGVDMIRNELMKVLEAEGLERYDGVGEKFDPNFHQAIFMEENDEVESEHIIEAFQVGYKLKDKVIRPAMVKVSK